MVINKYKEKRVLITGGLGFMGSTLAHRLVNMGSDVTILDAMFDERYGANWHNVGDILKDVKIVVGDIREGVIEGLVKNKEIIFHLAGQVGHYDSVEFSGYALEAEDINVCGSLNLLKACVKVNPLVRVIHAGSSFQYGDLKYIPVDEKHPTNPKVPYAISKQKAEEAHKEFNEKFGLDTVMLRIANPYGPRSQMRHSNYSFVNWFIRLAMDGEAIHIFGDGEQKKDLVFIDDLVDALLKLSMKPCTYGEVFNIGSGEGYKIKDIATRILNIVGSGRLEFEDFPEKYNSSGRGSYVSDIGKIKRMTGWFPQVNLEEGLKRTVDFYKKNREHYW